MKKKKWKALAINRAKAISRYSEKLDEKDVKIGQLTAELNSQAFELNEAKIQRAKANCWDIFREKLVEARTIIAPGGKGIFVIYLNPPGASEGEVIVAVENLLDNQNFVKTNKPRMLIDAINTLELKHSRINGK